MSRATNPFPGLRPFDESEEHLFFGRESQVDAMVDKLAASRFLAVVGPSGCGKSSLVNCGLLPALHRGLLATAGTSWKVAKFRPGRDPMRAMARSLARKNFLLKDFGGGFSLQEVVDTHLRVSKRGLLELYRRAHLPEKTNLLIVVDQFEELFRYASLSGSGDGSFQSEAIAFINLLLEPGLQDEFPIYVAITMRSDFLGDCSQFAGLPAAINSGQYLVPRMSRADRRLAIRGPVGVAQAEINPVLLTRLVNDVGDNPDQLSILQHALNRTWQVWSQSDDEMIELERYLQTGSMSGALDKHAEEAFARLTTPGQRMLCEKIFKAISDTGTDARGIRRPTVLSDICEIASAKIAELTEVIDVFRDSNSSFIMPPPPEPLEPDTVIDISHESLMRVWRRLMKWTAEEADDAERFRRLARTVALYDEDKAELLAGAELELMLKWRDEVKPNAAWAERYEKGFGKVELFLDESKSAALQREQKELEEREKAEELEASLQAERASSKRRKYVYLGLGMVTTATLLSALITWLLLTDAKSENKTMKAYQVTLDDYVEKLEKAKEAADDALARADDSLAKEREARLEAERAIALATLQADAVNFTAKAQSEAQATEIVLETEMSELEELEEEHLEIRQALARLSQMEGNGQLANGELDTLEAKFVHQQQKITEQRAEIFVARNKADAAEMISDSARAVAVVTVLGGSVIEIQNISYADSFDISQGTKVTKSSTNSSPPNIYGGGVPNWSEAGVSFFTDGRPADTVHWIEWETPKPISLNSVNLFAIHDEDVSGYRFRRAISNFKLFALQGSRKELLIDYSPTLPYGGDASGRNPGTVLAVCLPTMEPVKGESFRAEFTQAVDILGQFSGPRIVELDAAQTTCEFNVLLTDMLSDDKQKRRAATQTVKTQFRSDPRAVGAMLSELSPENFDSLSPQALVNLLWSLSQADPDVITPDLTVKAKQTIAYLKTKQMGPDAMEQFSKLEAYFKNK